jgi:3-oxoacyl-ACP reductase-like protein
MTDNRDESIVLDLIDEVSERLAALHGSLIDTEAIAHAAAQSLDAVTEADVDKAVARARSLATSSAAKVRELLDEVTAWQAELQGPRRNDKGA